MLWYSSAPRCWEGVWLLLAVWCVLFLPLAEFFSNAVIEVVLGLFVLDAERSEIVSGVTKVAQRDHIAPRGSRGEGRCARHCGSPGFSCSISAGIKHAGSSEHLTGRNCGGERLLGSVLPPALHPLHVEEKLHSTLREHHIDVM